MTETEIFTSLNNTLMATGLFAITWAFLVWVAGRAVTIAVENNAGIITKIVTTIFGLSALWQFNFAFAYVPWSFATAAHSLAVLKSSGTNLTLNGESFLNAFPGEVSALCNERCNIGARIPDTREDFPDPETPVTDVMQPSGNSTFIDCKLLCLAPLILILSLVGFFLLSGGCIAFLPLK